MILYQKTKDELNINFDDCTGREEVFCSCDYCGDSFKRSKRSILLGRRVIEKDSCKKCFRLKVEESNSKIYGAKKFVGSLEKYKKTCLERYGVEYASCSKEIKEKIKSTNLKKYGKSSFLATDSCRNSIKSKAQELYGVDNFAKAKAVKQKIKEKNIEKYGVESAMQLDVTKEKRKKTNIEKYGKENYSQTTEYLESRKKTCVKKYGVEHPSQLKENREKAKTTNLKKYGVTNYAKTKEFKENYTKVCLEKYGVHNPLILKGNQKYGKTQNEIKKWLNSLGFSFEKNNEILDGKELDLYNEDLKLAIEYCGLYWHNENSPQPRLREYHHQKYINCINKGIRLVLIFEDEWKNKREICESKIKSILGLHKKVYARKCEIKEIGKKEFNKFISENHIQGTNNLGLVFYALFSQKEIVGAISLGRHHRNKNNIILDRLCFKKNINVVGGSTRLFKACREWAKNNKYKTISSWSDNRWSLGTVYETMGFKLEEDLGPDYCYVERNNPKKRISKQSQSKKRTNCPEGKTEYEWCLERGLSRIWDCGKKRWVFEL